MHCPATGDHALPFVLKVLAVVVMLSETELDRLDAHLRDKFFEPAQGGQSSQQCSQESSQSSQLQGHQVLCRPKLGKRKHWRHVEDLEERGGLVKSARQEVLAAIAAGTCLEERQAQGEEWLLDYCEQMIEKTASDDEMLGTGCEGVTAAMVEFVERELDVDLPERAQALGLLKFWKAVATPPQVMMCALSLLLSQKNVPDAGSVAHTHTRTHTHTHTHTHTQRKVRLMSRVQGFEGAFCCQAMDSVLSSSTGEATKALIGMARFLVNHADQKSDEPQAGLHPEEVAEEVLRRAVKAVAEDPQAGAAHFSRVQGVPPDAGSIAARVLEKVGVEFQMEAVNRWLGSDSGLVCKPSRAGDLAGFCQVAADLISGACDAVFPTCSSAGGGQQHHNPNLGPNTRNGLKAPLDLMGLMRVRHMRARSVRACVRCGTLIVRLLLQIQQTCKLDLEHCIHRRQQAGALAPPLERYMLRSEAVEDAEAARIGALQGSPLTLGRRMRCGDPPIKLPELSFPRINSKDVLVFNKGNVFELRHKCTPS